MSYAIYNKKTNKPVVDQGVISIYLTKRQAAEACDSINDSDFEVRPVGLVAKKGAK